MRLIDANALLEAICKKCPEYDCKPDATDTVSGCLIYDVIESAPTIDAQPVKHGRWIPLGDDMWLCSNCKENKIFSMHESDRTEKQRYCCRCGARMDGGIDS